MDSIYWMDSSLHQSLVHPGIKKKTVLWINIGSWNFENTWGILGLTAALLHSWWEATGNSTFSWTGQRTEFVVIQELGDHWASGTCVVCSFLTSNKVRLQSTDRYARSYKQVMSPLLKVSPQTTNFTPFTNVTSSSACTLPIVLASPELNLLIPLML